MDVLVKWKDGKSNVVVKTQLKMVNKKPVTSMRVGSAVKMWYLKKYFYGTVLAMETDSDTSDFDSSDDIPLAQFRSATHVSTSNSTLNMTNPLPVDNSCRLDNQNTMTLMRPQQSILSRTLKTSRTLTLTTPQKILPMSYRPVGTRIVTITGKILHHVETYC